ncbi:hypothetical protein ElyMa_005622000 [Elysia marginata]|uniref:Uncharacterized protein n=1 Tax=Elysia marginata TaxID=1093978 RepID=A0AAV4F6V1_9GAST|nr:hypothetical protein ElyMa_005622000 [Elysia marginata]
MLIFTKLQDKRRPDIRNSDLAVGDLKSSYAATSRQCTVTGWSSGLTLLDQYKWSVVKHPHFLPDLTRCVFFAEMEKPIRYRFESGEERVFMQ